VLRGSFPPPSVSSLLCVGCECSFTRGRFIDLWKEELNQRGSFWYLQTFRLVQGLCTRINTIIHKHPLCLRTPLALAPFAAHTIARYSSFLPNPRYCDTCQTILVIAILLKKTRLIVRHLLRSRLHGFAPLK